MIQSIIKKNNLKDYSSLNYYYNSKRGLLEKTEDEMKLEDMYRLFNIYKLSADFKINQMKVLSSEDEWR
jgi:hypothetical protein